MSTCSTRKKVVPGQERRLTRKAKGDDVVDEGERVTGERAGGVIVRGRCTLERVVSLNKRMTKYQREAVKGTVFAPILKYCPFKMERNRVLALVKAWVPCRKAFRLGSRLVPFSVFDAALITGLPAVGQQVNFNEDPVMTELGNMVRQRGMRQSRRN